MFGGITFLRPLWLLALLPLAVFLWYRWQNPAHHDSQWRGLIDAHLLRHLLVNSAAGGRAFARTLLGTGALLTVLALAGPAIKQTAQPAYQRDVTRVLVVELSPATAAQLELVKVKLYALLNALSDGQTAMLVYGGEPYLVVPPTTDTKTIARFVPDLAVDVIPVAGNHPEHALRMAADVLQRSATGQRDLIWITAGARTDALPLTELEMTRLSILQVAGAVDSALAAVASRTGGVLVPMRADDTDVRQLISALQTRSGWVSGQGATQSKPNDLGHWLVLLLLPLGAWAFRRGILVAVLAPMLLIGLLMPRPALALDISWAAVAHYRAGEFAKAADLWAGGQDADSHYNRGNALAKNGQLAQALAAYETALQLRPDDADIRFNRDLLKRLLNPPTQSPKGGAGTPPPSGEAEREAARVGEQWLRGIPDQPGNLLRRKLLAEQKRRQSDQAGRAW